MDQFPGPHAHLIYQALFFFLLGCLKAIMYKDPVESKMDIIARVVCCAAIRETSSVFDHVGQSTLHWCQVCIVSDGAFFLHLLYHNNCVKYFQIEQ